MKVVVYNIKSSEKELLALANKKAHNLTLISNGLTAQTLQFAKAKDVVVISAKDSLNRDLLMELKDLGVNKIITRSYSTAHIDLQTAGQLDIQVANTPFPNQSDQGIAEQTIRNLNLWDMGKCVGAACCCDKNCAAVVSNYKG